MFAAKLLMHLFFSGMMGQVSEEKFFSNSLIIHKEKTKEIITVTMI